jgi:hypothetical protein
MKMKKCFCLVGPLIFTSKTLVYAIKIEILVPEQFCTGNFPNFYHFRVCAFLPKGLFTKDVLQHLYGEV